MQNKQMEVMEEDFDKEYSCFNQSANVEYINVSDSSLDDVDLDEEELSLINDEIAIKKASSEQQENTNTVDSQGIQLEKQVLVNIESLNKDIYSNVSVAKDFENQLIVERTLKDEKAKDFPFSVSRLQGKDLERYYVTSSETHPRKPNTPNVAVSDVNLLGGINPTAQTSIKIFPRGVHINSKKFQVSTRDIKVTISPRVPVRGDKIACKLKKFERNTDVTYSKEQPIEEKFLNVADVPFSKPSSTVVSCESEFFSKDREKMLLANNVPGSSSSSTALPGCASQEKDDDEVDTDIMEMMHMISEKTDIKTLHIPLEKTQVQNKSFRNKITLFSRSARDNLEYNGFGNSTTNKGTESMTNSRTSVEEGTSVRTKETKNNGDTDPLYYPHKNSEIKHLVDNKPLGTSFKRKQRANLVTDCFQSKNLDGKDSDCDSKISKIIIHAESCRNKIPSKGSDAFITTVAIDSSRNIRASPYSLHGKLEIDYGTSSTDNEGSKYSAPKTHERGLFNFVNEKNSTCNIAKCPEISQEKDTYKECLFCNKWFRINESLLCKHYLRHFLQEYITKIGSEMNEYDMCHNSLERALADLCQNADIAKYLRCNLCFEYFELHFRNRVVCRPKKPLKIFCCSKLFNSSIFRKLHWKKFLGPYCYGCCACIINFNSVQLLRIHMESHSVDCNKKSHERSNFDVMPQSDNINDSNLPKTGHPNVPTVVNQGFTLKDHKGRYVFDTEYFHKDPEDGKNITSAGGKRPSVANQKFIIQTYTEKRSSVANQKFIIQTHTGKRSSVANQKFVFKTCTRGGNQRIHETSKEDFCARALDERIIEVPLDNRCLHDLDSLKGVNEIVMLENRYDTDDHLKGVAENYMKMETVENRFKSSGNFSGNALETCAEILTDINRQSYMEVDTMEDEYDQVVANKKENTMEIANDIEIIDCIGDKYKDIVDVNDECKSNVVEGSLYGVLENFTEFAPVTDDSIFKSNKEKNDNYVEILGAKKDHDSPSEDPLMGINPYSLGHNSHENTSENPISRNCEEIPGLTTVKFIENLAICQGTSEILKLITEYTNSNVYVNRVLNCLEQETSTIEKIMKNIHFCSRVTEGIKEMVGSRTADHIIDVLESLEDQEKAQKEIIFKAYGSILANLDSSQFWCKYCATPFLEADKFNRHQHNKAFCIGQMKSVPVHLKETHQLKSFFQCPVCSMKFVNRMLRVNHLKIHFAYKLRRCPVCTKHFDLISQLTKHLLTHPNMKNLLYCCKKCNKYFVDEKVYNRHIQRHNAHKPHVCKICGKTFFRGLAFSLHVKNHIRNKWRKSLMDMDMYKPHKKSVSNLLSTEWNFQLQ